MCNLAIVDHYYEKYLQCDQPTQERLLQDLSHQQPDIHVQLMLLLHDDEIDDFFNTIEKELSQSFQGKCYDIGSKIGNYRLEEVVGTGGMAFVYRASRKDGLFQRDSAIKIVRKGLDSAKMTRNFKQECHIAAQLNHENIARVYDGGITDEGLPYLVMEFVDGLNIVEHCKMHNLDLSQRLKLFKQLTQAVAFCHANGIVHCDIKPNNVLVNKTGEVKLTDFGIARHMQEQSLIHNNIEPYRAMTMDYASPELRAGLAIDGYSDIYQLGLLLYEMITHEKAYKSKGEPLNIKTEKITEWQMARLIDLCTHPVINKRIDMQLLLKMVTEIEHLIQVKVPKRSFKTRISKTFDRLVKYAAMISL